MTLYAPNIGEREILKDFLLSQAIVVGLFKNVVTPDGTTTIDTLTEMQLTGGAGYAEIALSRDIVEDVETANKWYITTDANGRAVAQYGLAASPQAWTFNAVDVAASETVYGIFGYTWVLPFDQGAKEIKAGDIIKGATSAATGVVTAVEVQAGTWGAGTAAGYLKIMTKTGTFQNNESILVLGEVGTLNATPTAGGTGYALGDLVEITTGGVGALVVVTGEAGGVVSSVALATGGHGYTTGTGKATTKITGSGNDDLTVNITALANTAYAVTNTGTGADAQKKLLFTEAFSAGTPVTTVGQQITYLPIVSLASST